MTPKSNRGGLRNPKGGRPKKPPEELFRKRRITLPPEIDDKLRGRKDVSELIAQLLREYFERTEQ